MFTLYPKYIYPQYIYPIYVYILVQGGGERGEEHERARLDAGCRRRDGPGTLNPIS